MVSLNQVVILIFLTLGSYSLRAEQMVYTCSAVGFKNPLEWLSPLTVSFERDDNWENLCSSLKGHSLSFRASAEVSSDGFTHFKQDTTKKGDISGQFTKKDQYTKLSIEAGPLTLELREDMETKSIQGTLSAYGTQGKIECRRQVTRIP